MKQKGNKKETERKQKGNRIETEKKNKGNRKSKITNLEIIPFLKLHLLDHPSKPKMLHRHSNEAESKRAENRK